MSPPLKITFYALTVTLTLPAAVVGAGAVARFKNNVATQEKRTFECGFLPLTRARLPFSLQFFMISLVFLIFDVELIILFPFLIAPSIWQGGPYSPSIFYFVIFLAGSTLYEWANSGLEWLY